MLQPHVHHRSMLRAPRARDGVVLIIVLFAIILLAGMVFFVINLGWHAKTKTQTQNTADASAIAGAGWMARSFNTVAMNNVAQTQYLATVNTLDATPQAVSASHDEQVFLRDRLDDVLGTGLSIPHITLNNTVMQEFNTLRDELRETVDILEPVDDYFDGNDVASVTNWQAPGGGRGSLWQAMDALSDVSEAAITSSHVSAQINAGRMAQLNLASDNVADGEFLLLPSEPTVPYRSRSQADASGRYSRFDDFRGPVLYGLLPSDTDHKTVNRGPFDTVFGWRSATSSVRDPDYPPILGQTGTPGQSVAQVSDGGGGPFGGPGNQSTPGSVTSATAGGRIMTAYRTYGMQSRVNSLASNVMSGRPSLQRSRYLRFLFGTSSSTHNILDQTNHKLRESRGGLVQAKLNYLWPSDNRTRNWEFAVPRWRDNYPTSVSYPAEDFSETLVWTLDIKSRFRRSDPQFMTPGSWAFERAFSTQDNRSRVQFRWSTWWLPRRNDGDTNPDNDEYHVNPNIFESLYANQAMNVTPLGNHAWLFEWQYELLWDYSIGIAPLFTVPDDDDEQPELIPQTAYYFQVVVFAGRNVNPIPPQAFDPQAAALEHADDDHILDAINDTTLTVPVPNPYIGFDPDTSDAPAPLDLDPTLLSRDGRTPSQLRDDIVTFNRERLTYAFLVRRPDRPPMWGDKFTQHSAESNFYCIASARVFNTHSHDLWTQMWHAQLVPVDDYDRWVDQLSTSTLPDDVQNYLPIADGENFRTYFESLRDLAPLVMTH